MIRVWYTHCIFEEQVFTFCHWILALWTFHILHSVKCLFFKCKCHKQFMVKLVKLDGTWSCEWDERPPLCCLSLQGDDVTRWIGLSLFTRRWRDSLYWVVFLYKAMTWVVDLDCLSLQDDDATRWIMLSFFKGQFKNTDLL